MGRINDSSILAGSTGRTGRVVVATVNGLQYSRIRPKKHSTGPTEKQALIQQRMKDTITFMESYKTYACKYFGKRVGAKSIYNQAMANIMENLQIDFEHRTITPIYENIAFSKGTLLPPIPISITISGSDKLIINWQDNSAGNPERENDLLQVLIVPKGSMVTYFAENAATRSEQTYGFSLYGPLIGKTLHVYFAFKAANEKEASTSVYAGSIS